MIEIGEKCESGIRKVFEWTDDTVHNHLGDIVKTDTGLWLAIPIHYKKLQLTAHKLRRNAIGALLD